MQAGPLAVEQPTELDVLQRISHVPPEQTAEPVPAPETGTGHAWLQLPQWARSLFVSVHWPLQSSWPDGQPSTHVPLEHTCSLLHVTPQPPQLSLSLSRFTHCAPQLEKPALQDTPHVPLLQVATPFVGIGQRLSHAPQ
jgi:hypothetical protein